MAELVAIRDYIGHFNPLAAQRLADRILKAGNALDMFPDRGRMISRDRRELTIVRPYLIRYRRTGQMVTILEIRHSAREPD